LKGFTKDGKFRPTENRTKSSINKSDVENAKTEADMSSLLLKSIKSTPEYKRGDVRIINDLGLERSKKTLEHTHDSRDKKSFHHCPACDRANKEADEFEANSKRSKESLDKSRSQIVKNWTMTELHSEDGDGKVIIYTNKDDPKLTVEMHPMDDDFDEDIENGYEARHYDAWYIFPARNGKGIPSSPEILSESGGFTRKDAIDELIKQVQEVNEEL